MRKLNCLVLTFVLCLVCTFSVFAESGDMGSLVIKNVDRPVRVYLVARVDGTPTTDFAQACKEPLTEQTANAVMAKQLRDFVQNQTVSEMRQQPGNNRQVSFADLEQGYYLVCSTGSPGEFAPFMLRIPMTATGKEVYDVMAEPKRDTGSQPVNPAGPGVQVEPNIPQTGSLQWPKYLLLCLGAAAILWGAVDVVLGREKSYE